MIKYFLGSLVVLIISTVIVYYSVNNTVVAEKSELARGVPVGEYEGMSINKADNDEYILSIDNLHLYQSREKQGTSCTTDVKIYFPKKKNAKLVMKLRYNIGPFMAKAIKDLSVSEALKPDTQYKMISSLKEGYAKKYGIKNMTKVILEDYSCQFIK